MVIIIIIPLVRAAREANSHSRQTFAILFALWPVSS